MIYDSEIMELPQVHITVLKKILDTAMPQVCFGVRIFTNLTNLLGLWK